MPRFSTWSHYVCEVQRPLKARACTHIPLALHSELIQTGHQRRHSFFLSSLTFQQPFSSSLTPLQPIHPSHLLSLQSTESKFKLPNRLQSGVACYGLQLVDLSRRAGMFILGLWHFLFGRQTRTQSSDYGNGLSPLSQETKVTFQLIVEVLATGSLNQINEIWKILQFTHAGMSHLKI